MRKLELNKVYKHFKGDLYIVLDVAINSETDKKMVVYRALYDDCKLYVRDYDMFLSEVDHVKYPDVNNKYRFELQNIKSVKILSIFCFYRNFLIK